MSSTVVDAYTRPLLHAYFDESGKLEYIEIGEPEVLRLDGEQHFIQSPETVRHRLEKIDEVVGDSAGFDCFGIGLTVYVEDDQIKGVGICRRDHAKRLKST